MNNHDWEIYFQDMDEWDICYINRLIGEEKLITMPEGRNFLGLYINLGAGHKYDVENYRSGTINSAWYNFIFMPEEAAQLTLKKGIYEALCIEFPKAILFRFAERHLVLKKLLKGEFLETPVILSYINMVITPEMNDAIREIIVNTKRYEGDLKKVVKPAKVITLLECALINIEAIVAARLKREDVEMAVTVHDYLMEHLNGIFSVDQLADMLGIYRRKLERTFKVVYRKPVIRFFLEAKLKQAATLLRDTDLQTKQIASKIGYKSIPRFSETFKKYYQCSPTEYREQNR
jgi:AraC-like DNA-binding protein